MHFLSETSSQGATNWVSKPQAIGIPSKWNPGWALSLYLIWSRDGNENHVIFDFSACPTVGVSVYFCVIYPCCVVNNTTNIGLMEFPRNEEWVNLWLWLQNSFPVFKPGPNPSSGRNVIGCAACLVHPIMTLSFRKSIFGFDDPNRSTIRVPEVSVPQLNTCLNVGWSTTKLQVWRDEVRRRSPWRYADFTGICREGPTFFF